jgi:hypothetical protein
MVDSLDGSAGVGTSGWLTVSLPPAGSILSPSDDGAV